MNKGTITTAINNKITPIDQAQIPITDRGFLFGHSLFETILVYQGKIIQWQAHFERLKQGCLKSLIAVPHESELHSLAKKVIAEQIKQQGASTSDKLSLRIMVTGGNSLDLAIKNSETDPQNSNVMMICRAASLPNQDMLDKGISLASCPDVRNPALLDVKSTHYLFNLLALENAKAQGFDDALFVRKHSFTESTTANFIWLDHKFQVHSAPFDQNCLPGTTLSLLVKIFEKKGIPFSWKALTQKNVFQCQGAAIVSSLRGVLAVRQIDQTQFDVSKSKDFFAQMNLFLAEEYRTQP